MFNIEDVLSSNKLLDGRYRLLRKLNTDRDAVELWMARDITTIDRDAAANDESSGKIVSIMICHPADALDIEDEQRWQDQFDAAHDCRHPNLIPPEEYAVVNDTYYLVFPYSEVETLSKFVGKNQSDRVTMKLISDLASGLNELHTHQPIVIHNGIQPSNIIVYNDDDFLLTNYGIHFESDSQRIKNQDRSLAYMAPERFQGDDEAGPEGDVWAFGATLYEVLTGKKPFGKEGGKNQRLETPMPPLSDQSAVIVDLVYACLQADPKKRPTAQQILDLTSTKKRSAKQKKKKNNKQAKEQGDTTIQFNNRTAAIVGAAILLIGVLVAILRPRHHEDNPYMSVDKDVVEINYYEKAVEMLSDKTSAQEGLNLLDSLVSAKDWQATFLLSRLYFDTKGRDTLLYDKQWGIMRENCDITFDNERAHNYLFDAFELYENDFMILYQLGCDYLAGNMRGCKRNLNYALWCFDNAERTIKNSNSNNARYLDALEEVRERISRSNYSPVKPIR